jgi:hypothetical protein
LVYVPEIDLTIEEDISVALRGAVNPLRASENNGIDIYIDCLNFLHQSINI